MITSFGGPNLPGIFDRGTTFPNLAFTATANNTPTSASVAWSFNSIPVSSQPVTSGTSMSGTIPGPFNGLNNGDFLQVTLSAVFPDGTQMNTQTDIWADRVIYLLNGDSQANVTAADTTYLETILTDSILATARGGSFAATPAGANVFPIAVPTEFGVPTWMVGVFVITPTFVGTFPAYQNVNGVTISMDLYYFPNGNNTYVMS